MKSLIQWPIDAVPYPGASYHALELMALSFLYPERVRFDYDYLRAFNKGNLRISRAALQYLHKAGFYSALDEDSKKRCFHYSVKPFSARQYVAIYLDEWLKLNTASGRRLFWHLHKWISAGEFTYKADTLRQAIAEGKSYKRNITEFEKKALLPAILDIRNVVNYQFGVKETKKIGRAIYSYTFEIAPQNKPSDNLFNQLLKFGFNSMEIQGLVQRHDARELMKVAHIVQVAQGSGIIKTKPAAYFRGVLSNKSGGSYEQ